MSTPLKRLPMSKAIKTLLAEVTGYPWEIRSIPRVESVAVSPPYGILYPLWTTLSGTPFHHPEADATWVYQATLTSAKGTQIEWGHDKIVEAIVGRDDAGNWLHDIAVDGQSVMGREMGDENDGSGIGGVATDLLTHDLRFAVYVTPV